MKQSVNYIRLAIACSILSTCYSLDVSSGLNHFGSQINQKFQLPEALQVGLSGEQYLEEVIDDGNKFSHQNRLFQYNFNENNGVSLDYFGGLIFGHFPYYDADVYQAIVHDYKIQGSLNLTATVKFELLNLIKFELEIEVVPLMLGGGFSVY